MAHGKHPDAGAERPCSLQTEQPVPEKTALVVVTYQNVDDTLRCLDSIYAMHRGPGRIIVVENGSDAATVEELFSAWQKLAEAYGEKPPAMYPADRSKPGTAVMLRVERNKGYACGCNAGLRAVMADDSCEAVWLLNNDVIVERDTLEALCDRLRMRPDAGMAASLLADMDSRHILQCAGGGSFSRISGVTRDLGAGWDVQDTKQTSAEALEARIDYVCGASALLRRRALDAVGLMDERFYLYYEDVDYSLRLQRKKHTISIAVNSIVYHKGGVTTSKERHIDFYATRNRLYCVLAYAPYSILFTLLHVCCGILKSLLFGRFTSAKLRIRAVAAFLYQSHESALP